MKTTLFSRPMKALFLVALLSFLPVKGWCTEPFDYIMINPTILEKDDPVATTSRTISFSIVGTSSHQNVSFNFYVKEDIDVDIDYPEKGDLLPYTKDRGGNRTYKHTIVVENSTPDMVNYKKYTVSITGSEDFTENSGVLFSLYAGGQANADVGLFPVYVNNVTIDGASIMTENTRCITSYVKVTPFDGALQLTLKDVVPYSVSTSINEESQIQTVDLTNVTAVGGPITKSTTYTKEIPANTWGTICAPHDLLSDANIQYYSAVSTGTGYVKVPVGVVKGGTSAIYHTYGGAAQTLENKWNNSGFNFGEQGTGLVGVNTITTVEANSGYFIDESTGEFEVNTAAKEVTAFDAYFNTEVSTLPIALQVTDAGYATFHSTVSDYVLPDGAEAFIVKNVGSGDSEKSVYLMSCGKNIASGTAVIVKAAEGFYNLTVPGSALTAPSGNKLVGGIEIPNAKAYYSLESANTFKRFYTGSSQTTPDDDAVPSYNKAYLPE